MLLMVTHIYNKPEKVIIKNFNFNVLSLTYYADDDKGKKIFTNNSG